MVLRVASHAYRKFESHFQFIVVDRVRRSLIGSLPITCTTIVEVTQLEIENWMINIIMLLSRAR